MELSSTGQSFARAIEPSVATDIIPDALRQEFSKITRESEQIVKLNTFGGEIPYYYKSTVRRLSGTRMGELFDLLDSYYDYLNEKGLPSHELNNLGRVHDLDHTEEKYFEAIRKTIAISVPTESVLNRERLYKILLQFYHARGSQDSVLAFFKLFLGEDVGIWYPKEVLMDTSATRSIASNRFKIQDSYRWQDFSYVIDGLVNNAVWKDDYLKFLHPAGLKLFIALGVITPTEKFNIDWEDLEDLTCNDTVKGYNDYLSNYDFGQASREFIGITSTDLSENSNVLGGRDFASYLIIGDESPAVAQTDSYDWEISLDNPAIRMDSAPAVLQAPVFPWGPDSTEISGGIPGPNRNLESESPEIAHSQGHAWNLFFRTSNWNLQFGGPENLGGQICSWCQDENRRRGIGGVWSIASWIKPKINPIEPNAEYVLFSKTRYLEPADDDPLGYLDSMPGQGGDGGFAAQQGFYFGASAKEGKGIKPFFTAWDENAAKVIKWEAEDFTLDPDVWSHITFSYDFDAQNDVLDENGEPILDENGEPETVPGLQNRVKIYVNGSEIKTIGRVGLHRGGAAGLYYWFPINWDGDETNPLVSDPGSAAYYYPGLDAAMPPEWQPGWSWSSVVGPEDEFVDSQGCIGGFAGKTNLPNVQDTIDENPFNANNPLGAAPAHGLFNGKMADFRIYATALDESAAENIYRGNPPRKEDLLQAWYFKNKEQLHSLYKTPIDHAHPGAFGHGNNPIRYGFKTTFNTDGPFDPKLYRNSGDRSCTWARCLLDLAKIPALLYNARIQECARLNYGLQPRLYWQDWDKSSLTHVRVLDENTYDQETARLPPDYYLHFRKNEFVEERYLRIYYELFIICFRLINDMTELGLFHKPYIVSEKFRDPSAFTDGYLDHKITDTFDSNSDPKPYDPEHDFQFKQYAVALLQDAFVCSSSIEPNP